MLRRESRAVDRPREHDSVAGCLVDREAALERVLDILVDALDEYNLLTFPVVVGGGKRLFGDSARPTGLRPISQATTGSGVRIDVWEAAGEPQHAEADEIDR